jgi:single-strand DNA-binding protein
VVSFNGVAAACAEYLARGRQVYVEGRLRTRTYTNRNDEEKTVTELLAHSVIFLGPAPAEDGDRDEPRPKPGAPRRAPNGKPHSSQAGYQNDPDVPF